MKIAILFGGLSVGARPLDFWFKNIFESSRGLTGSDLSAVLISKELAGLGHDVSLFTVHAQPNHHPTHWEGVKLYNIEEKTIIDDQYDGIVSINDVNDLLGAPKKPFKIVLEYLNDFPFAQPNYDDFVDLYLSPCEEHKNYLKNMTPSPHKWGVLPLGCDPDWYDQSKKIRGRIVYCSSGDRGLHLALQQFPEIKKAVPEATFKIFYHFGYGKMLEIEHNANDHFHLREMSARINYCLNSVEKMKHLGVERVGSVSAEQMKKEMSEASLLLFPVDTISYSEGFSVSILSAHASGALPVISSCDSIGSIYRNSGCMMVDAPVKNHLKEYTDFAIRALTDDDFAAERRKQCLEFAKKFLWIDIVKKLESIITNRTDISKK